MNNTNSILSPKIRPRCVQACENCRRRKERCNGLQPCQRCRSRNVGSECRFTQSTPMPSHQSRLLRTNIRSQTLSHARRATYSSLLSPATSEPLYTTSYTISLRDASVSTILPSVRAIAQTSIGNCDFSTSIIDPVRDPPVKTPDLRVPGESAYMPPNIDADEAVRFLDWFLYSTSGMLDLFDLERVHAELEAWMADSRRASDLQSSIFYLVLAIGAQTCPSGLDLVAGQYYNYGRLLGIESATRETSYASLQYFSLVGAYLMGASLMDAAFIQIGSAVRAAIVLGLHREEQATAVGSCEAQMRKRLWRSVRTHDLFLSVTLGRPIATTRYPDTALITDHSATGDVSNILEAVLIEIYAKGSLRDDVVQSIIDHHRVCVGQFNDGLENDGLGSSEYDEHRRPHIGVCNIKHCSYATIQLLTMPFLIKRVSLRPHTTKSPIPSTDLNDSVPSSLSPESMAFACIDAGMSIVELFHKFVDADQTPRRLPVVVYAMFYVALSLGLAIFGDLDLIFPLQESIQTAWDLLVKFGKYDWLAERYAVVVGQMQAACKIHIQNRSKIVTCAHRARVQQLFGSLDQQKDTGRQDHARVFSQEMNTLRASTRLSTAEPRPMLAELRIEESGVYINSTMRESSPSRDDKRYGGQGLDEQPSMCAEEFSPFPTGADGFFGTQLWDSIWLDEEYVR